MLCKEGVYHLIENETRHHITKRQQKLRRRNANQSTNIATIATQDERLDTKSIISKEYSESIVPLGCPMRPLSRRETRGAQIDNKTVPTMISRQIKDLKRQLKLQTI